MTDNIIHTPRKTSLSETGSRSLTSELSVQRPEGASYGGSGKEISRLLSQDIPVILSIGGNFPLIWKKDRLPLYKKTGDGVYIKSSSTRAHYVTVTGIEHGWLRISSWGQEWYINWREYRNFARTKSCPLFSNICYITRKH